MRMQRKRFRIGELAKRLNVERFVIRFWEKEFCLKSTRSPGGQRFYSDKDLERFELIKELLYEKRYTIAGAKQFIQHQHPTTTKVLASHKTTMQEEVSVSEHDEPLPDSLVEQLLILKSKLIKLREIL